MYSSIRYHLFEVNKIKLLKWNGGRNMHIRNLQHLKSRNLKKPFSRRDVKQHLAPSCVRTQKKQQKLAFSHGLQCWTVSSAGNHTGWDSTDSCHENKMTFFLVWFQNFNINPNSLHSSGKQKSGWRNWKRDLFACFRRLAVFCRMSG